MMNTQLYLILLTILNIFLLSNTQYVGKPLNVSQTRVTLKTPVTLICEYTGADGNGEFLAWYKDGTELTADKTGHYVVKTTEKDSQLIITLHEEDLAVKKWSVKTKKLGQEEPVECQYNKILAFPSPKQIVTNRASDKLDAERTTIKRLEDEVVHLKCILVPSQKDRQGRKKTQWSYSKNGVDFSYLPIEVKNISENEIAIDRIKKSHQGQYRCSFNNIDSTVVLRVKDPYAALYPFIGIVVTVLILVVIILIYEKRHKAAKKSAAAAAAAEDEVNDNANDPLVVSSNKLSDNENNKRTVKA